MSFFKLNRKTSRLINDRYFISEYTKDDKINESQTLQDYIDSAFLYKNKRIFTFN